MQWTRQAEWLLHSLGLVAVTAFLLGLLCASSASVSTIPAVMRRASLALVLTSAPWSLAPLAQARRLLRHPRAGGARPPSLGFLCMHPSCAS